MAAEIELGSLLSRAKRLAFSENGRKTIRRAVSEASKDEAGGGIVGWIWGGVKNLVGFLLSKIWEGIKKFISWSFTTLVQWVTSTFQFIWNFNWNASDAELDQLVENQYSSLLVQAGSTLGSMLGWLVCGLGPGAVIFAFNEPLGVYLLNSVGQEALDEIIPVIGGLIRTALRTTTRHAVTGTFKRLKNWLLDKNEAQFTTDDSLKASSKTSVDKGEMTQKEADQWVEKQKRIRDAAKSRFEKKPWSFQKSFEQWRENNIPKKLQDAAEEFVEEFSDSCIEALYCLASAGDNYVAMQKNSAASVLGGQEVIEVTFNRDADKTPT